MIRAVFIVFFISLGSVLIGQTRLEGYVFEENSKSVVPYAVVVLKNNRVGTYTDSTGKFSLAGKLTETDTLVVSCVGYEPKRIACSTASLQIPQHIELKKLVYQLKSVTVANKKYKVVQLGKNKPPVRGWIPLYVGNQIAIFFNSPEISNGFVNKVFFYIDGERICPSNSKVRIRLYGHNPKRGGPGADILNQQLIISNPKPGWNEVDIRKFYVDVPVDGFYVALESLAAYDSCYHWVVDKSTNAVRYYNVVLASAKKSKKSEPWWDLISFDYNIWHCRRDKMFNPMIKVEIAY
jgi:hypothetical protein